MRKETGWKEAKQKQAKAGGTKASRQEAQKQKYFDMVRKIFRKDCRIAAFGLEIGYMGKEVHEIWHEKRPGKGCVQIG